MTTFNRDHVLDSLDFLARVEHAMCTESLELAYVMGHGLPGRERSPADPEVSAAAGTAFSSAFDEMRHLSIVNGALTRAGRPLQFDRAVAVDASFASGSLIAFGPIPLAELPGLAERATALGAAVDSQYAALARAVEGADPSADGELVDDVRSVLDGCAHHRDTAAALTEQLSSLPTSRYLRVTRREPADDYEWALLSLSRRHYELAVALIRASKLEDFSSFDGLREKATSMMTTMDSFNSVLVARGLLPVLSPASGDEAGHALASPG